MSDRNKSRVGGRHIVEPSEKTVESTHKDDEKKLKKKKESNDKKEGGE